MTTFFRDPTDGGVLILARVSAEAMRDWGRLPGYEGYIGSAEALAHDPTDACLPESIPYVCAVDDCRALFVPDDGFAYLCDRCQRMIDNAIAEHERALEDAAARYHAAQWG